MVELLPYNWGWRGLSRIYANLTASLADIHHVAWRAGKPRWVAYADDDEARYADWTPQECSSE